VDQFEDDRDSETFVTAQGLVVEEVEEEEAKVGPPVYTDAAAAAAGACMNTRPQPILAPATAAGAGRSQALLMSTWKQRSCRHRITA
jgi:hypothetical protein